MDSIKEGTLAANHKAKMGVFGVSTQFVREAIYSDESFSGSAPGISLSYCVFSKCNFKRVNLNDSRLFLAHFIGCSFLDCTFNNAFISGCTFSDCEFIEPYVTGANILRCAFTRTRFARESLSVATFHATSFHECSFSRTPIKEGSLVGGSSFSLCLFGEKGRLGLSHWHVNKMRRAVKDGFFVARSTAVAGQLSNIRILCKASPLCLSAFAKERPDSGYIADEISLESAYIVGDAARTAYPGRIRVRSLSGKEIQIAIGEKVAVPDGILCYASENSAINGD